MRRTVKAPLGTYSGLKCPACPTVTQGGKKGLKAHWRITHTGPVPEVKPPPMPKLTDQATLF